MNNRERELFSAGRQAMMRSRAEPPMYGPGPAAPEHDPEEMEWLRNSLANQGSRRKGKQSREENKINIGQAMPPGWNGPFGDTVKVDTPARISISKDGARVEEDDELMEMLMGLRGFDAQPRQGGTSISGMQSLGNWGGY